jgi:N-acetylmuramoyl-L-alanine amidase
VISLEDQKKKSPKTEVPKKPMGHDKISLAQQLGLGVRKIVIDPGHGGKDPGAMAYNLKEKDIVLKVSKKIAKILKATYRYEVAMTRTKDVYIPLEERTAIANTQSSDLFISIHVNAHPDKTIGGIETYFLNLATNADAMRVAALENSTSTHKISDLQDILANLMKNSKIDESSRLAQFVQTNLISGVEQKYKTRNLGVKQAPFYVLIGAQMPAILAEISFITNPEEAKLLQDEHYLDKIAQQIAAGIAAYVDHHHTAAVKF